MGGGTIRIDQGEIIGQNDAVAHLLAAEALAGQHRHRIGHLCRHQRLIGEVGKDAQKHLATGDAFNQAGDALAHGVDQVGAHGVTGVHQQMDHQHVLAGGRRLMQMHLDVLGAAAAGDHVRMQAVGQVDDFAAALLDLVLCLGRVWHINDLDLADEQLFRALHPETTRAHGLLGCRADGGDNGRFFHRHRHQVGLVVDNKVQPHAHGYSEHADDILDHLVGSFRTQRVAAAGKLAQFVLVQQTALLYCLNALFQAEFVKTGNTGFVHAGNSSSRLIDCAVCYRDRIAQNL